MANILLALHQFFPRFYTGTETLTHEVAKELQACGHNVSILCVEPNTPDISYPIEPELHCDTYDGLTVWRVFTGDLGAPSTHLDRESDDKKLVTIFEEVLKEAKPDIVHAFHLMRLTLSFVETVKKHEIPFYFTTTDFWLLCPTYQLLKHNEELCVSPDRRSCLECLISLYSAQMNEADPLLTKSNIGLFKTLKQILESRMHRNRRIFDLVDGVFWSNEFLKEIFIKNGFVPKNHKIVTFPVPKKADSLFDLSLPVESPLLRIAFIGTLMPSKGPQVAIRAVRGLASNAPVQLSIWGAPLQGKEDFEAGLKKLAEGDRRISFKGVFPQENFGEVLSSVDVLVIPSLWYENTPLTALSAQAAHRLLIVSDLGGLSPLIESGRNGYVFPPGNDIALSNLLLKLIEDKDKLPLMAKNIKPPGKVGTYVQEIVGGYREYSAGVEI